MKLFSILGRGGLILASAGLSLACSSAASTNTSTVPLATATVNPATAFPVPSPTQNPENNVPRITAQESKKLVDEGKAIIIDVRGTEAYKTAHIKGALDYPLSKIEAKDFSGLPKNKRIIAYCT